MEKLELIQRNIQDEMRRLLELRIQKMIQIYEDTKMSVQVELNDKLNHIIDGKKGCVMISYLRSSYITGSHKVKIAFYETELFVEKDPPAFSYSISSYLKGVEDDVNNLWKKIEKEFVQVFVWRQEEVRRNYMGKVYEASEHIFRKYVNELQGKGEIIKVFFGEEMGKVEQIGIISSGRS